MKQQDWKISCQHETPALEITAAAGSAMMCNWLASATSLSEYTEKSPKEMFPVRSPSMHHPQVPVCSSWRTPAQWMEHRACTASPLAEHPSSALQWLISQALLRMETTTTSRSWLKKPEFSWSPWGNHPQFFLPCQLQWQSRNFVQLRNLSPVTLWGSACLQWKLIKNLSKSCI